MHSFEAVNFIRFDQLLNLCRFLILGHRYTSVAEINREQDENGSVQYTHEIRNRKPFSGDASFSPDKSNPLLYDQDGKEIIMSDGLRDRACSIISDTRENEQDVARRIPWGHFLKHPTSRTLLFTWWVVAWIG